MVTKSDEKKTWHDSEGNPHRVKTDDELKRSKMQERFRNRSAGRSDFYINENGYAVFPDDYDPWSY